MRTLKQILWEARGMSMGKKAEITYADLERLIDSQDSPPPAFDCRTIRYMETAACPGGLLLRNVIAALRGGQGLPAVNLFEALRSIEFWPPLHALSPEEFVAFCQDTGIEVGRRHGRRMVITLPEAKR